MENICVKVKLKNPIKSGIHMENTVRYLTRGIETAAAAHTLVHKQKNSNDYLLEKRKLRKVPSNRESSDKILFNNKIKIKNN